MSPAELKLISCRLCGAIIVKISRDVCPKCHVIEEENFVKVRDFLRANPGSPVEEIVKETRVPEPQVNRFISSGRLERVNINVDHTCQTCHRTIPTGLICPECAKNLKEQVIQLKRDLKALQDKEQFRPNEGGRKPPGRR